MLQQRHESYRTPGVRCRLRVHDCLASSWRLLEANLALRRPAGPLCCSLLLK